MFPLAILTIENDDDREFMAKLYIEYRWLIFSEAKKLVGYNVAEDIVQDSIVKLIDKIDLLKTFDKKRATSYIAETAKNSAISYLRGSGNRPIFFDTVDSFEDSGIDVERIAIKNLDYESLRKIWPKLKPETQTLLIMKYELLLSNEEIAERYSIKAESVRMRLTRARREAFKLLNT